MYKGYFTELTTTEGIRGTIALESLGGRVEHI